MSCELNEATIIEGFICPECLVSYGTAGILRLHFQSAHRSAPYSPGATDKQLCSASAIAATKQSYAFYELPHQHGSHSGLCISLCNEFMQLRKSRLNRDALESNSLSIRLEKLVSAAKEKTTNIKEFEKTVIPWVDVKAVNLCPSCGNSFGLGIEPAFPEEPHSCSDTQLKCSRNDRRLLSCGKRKLTKLTNALLDYNPVYRRHHHCRMCGHVLCADCSIFVSISMAESLLSHFNTSQVGEISSDLLQYLHGTTSDVDKKSTDAIYDERDVSPYAIRMCAVCKDLLCRRWQRKNVSSQSSPVVGIHTELRKHMAKVVEGSPSYLSMANSLSCGEQKYALDMARTTREDLLDHLQSIDAIRRKLDKLVEQSSAVEPAPDRICGLTMNSASLRLLRALIRMARQFLQENLPALRVLPTMQQYDSLTVQRRDELTLRWQHEDEALLQLEKRLQDTETIGASSDKPHLRMSRKQDALPNHQREVIARQVQLAEAMDRVSQRLLVTKDPGQTAKLMNELSSIEKEIATLSISLSKS